MQHLRVMLFLCVVLSYSLFVITQRWPLGDVQELPPPEKDSLGQDALVQRLDKIQRAVDEFRELKDRTGKPLIWRGYINNVQDEIESTAKALDDPVADMTKIVADLEDLENPKSGVEASLRKGLRGIMKEEKGFLENTLQDLQKFVRKELAEPRPFEWPLANIQIAMNQLEVSVPDKIENIDRTWNNWLDIQKELYTLKETANIARFKKEMIEQKQAEYKTYVEDEMHRIPREFRDAFELLSEDAKEASNVKKIFDLYIAGKALMNDVEDSEHFATLRSLEVFEDRLAGWSELRIPRNWQEELAAAMWAAKTGGPTFSIWMAGRVERAKAGMAQVQEAHYDNKRILDRLHADRPRLAELANWTNYHSLQDTRLTIVQAMLQEHPCTLESIEWIEKWVAIQRNPEDSTLFTIAKLHNILDKHDPRNKSNLDKKPQDAD